MSIRTKSILIFIGGIVTGIILTFAVLFFIALGNAAMSPTDENVVLFEKPQGEINAEQFEVFQVLPNGNALANVKGTYSSYMVVLFLAEEGASYYDDQIITVPSDKRVMHIGTFVYKTRSEIEKTVPVVEITDK